MNHILYRTAAATGVSKATFSMIKTEKDVQNQPIESGGRVQVIQDSQVPKSLATVNRKVTRDFFPEKKVELSVYRIFREFLH